MLAISVFDVRCGGDGINHIVGQSMRLVGRCVGAIGLQTIPRRQVLTPQALVRLESFQDSRSHVIENNFDLVAMGFVEITIVAVRIAKR